MDDLIRREDAMQRFLDEVKQSRKDHIHINTIKRLLDDIDVAYNVDKVCEQLDANAQKMSEAKAIGSYAKCSPADHRYYKAISVKKAKEIVKAGGVNE